MIAIAVQQAHWRVGALLTLVHVEALFGLATVNLDGSTIELRHGLDFRMVAHVPRAAHATHVLVDVFCLVEEGRGGEGGPW